MSIPECNRKYYNVECKNKTLCYSNIPHGANNNLLMVQNACRIKKARSQRMHHPQNVARNHGLIRPIIMLQVQCTYAYININSLPNQSLHEAWRSHLNTLNLDQYYCMCHNLNRRHNFWTPSSLHVERSSTCIPLFCLFLVVQST